MAQTIDTTSGQPIQPVTIVGASNSGTGSVNIDITQSDVIVPMDIQSHLQSTIQTHNAVSVALSSASAEANWHDSDGFDKLAVTLLSDSGTGNNHVVVMWSNDATTYQGSDVVIVQGTGFQRSGITDTKSRYFKLQVFNNDATIAHTMSVWAYLKA
jgi:hypothetical protein